MRLRFLMVGLTVAALAVPRCQAQTRRGTQDGPQGPDARRLAASA